MPSVLILSHKSLIISKDNAIQGYHVLSTPCLPNQPQPCSLEGQTQHTRLHFQKVHLSYYALLQPFGSDFIYTTESIYQLGNFFYLFSPNFVTFQSLESVWYKSSTISHFYFLIFNNFLATLQVLYLHIWFDF